MHGAHIQSKAAMKTPAHGDHGSAVQRRRHLGPVAGAARFAACCAALLAARCSDSPPAPPPPLGVLFCDLPANAPDAHVPDGFCVRRFAVVKTPRTLAFAPNGDLFVASPAIQTPGGAPPGLS